MNAMPGGGDITSKFKELNNLFSGYSRDVNPEGMAQPGWRTQFPLYAGLAQNVGRVLGAPPTNVNQPIDFRSMASNAINRAIPAPVRSSVDSFRRTTGPTPESLQTSMRPIVSPQQPGQTTRDPVTGATSPLGYSDAGSDVAQTLPGSRMTASVRQNESIPRPFPSSNSFNAGVARDPSRLPRKSNIPTSGWYD